MAGSIEIPYDNNLNFNNMEKTGSINGHDYVDLGLPSGILWATCNVGANYPYEKGNYYAWGETTTKQFYGMSNYKFCRGEKITKYTKSDGRTLLISSDDTATINWGSAWRMPTKEEFEELRRCCKWEESRMQFPNQDRGISGYKIIGPNGNSIFLPNAGGMDDHGYNTGGGHYWTKTRGYLDYTAWRMLLNYEGNIVNLCYISFGLPVRPVASKKSGNSSSKSKASGGCYVATAVYGSYNCPQVWTLRRFRDNTLDETWYGRAFIKTYYAISPTLVKWFGETDWFKKMWRKPLDKLVSSLQKKGISSTPYQDKY